MVKCSKAKVIALTVRLYNAVSHLFCALIILKGIFYCPEYFGLSNYFGLAKQKNIYYWYLYGSASGNRKFLYFSGHLNKINNL